MSVVKVTSGQGDRQMDERARLIAALEHDAKQPHHSLDMGVRAMRLGLDHLRTCRSDPSKFETVLHTLLAELSSIQAAARQVIDTQQDLFDALRLQFGLPSPGRRAILARDVIERACVSNQAIGKARSIAIKAVRSRLTFVSDERRVERILNNLITNAIFHSGGTKIICGARRLKGDIVFEVRDNGRGMERKKVANVFDQISLSRLPSGYLAAQCGLGLHNVREFTERLGGAVDCVSAPGRGTAFRVRLPGPVGVIEPTSLSIADVKAPRADRRFVVILDSDLEFLRAVEGAMLKLGADVYGDHDPLRWLNVVTDLKRVPDLFLLGYELAGQDCSLQLDILRRKWRDRDPKVVVLANDLTMPGLRRLSANVPTMCKPLSEKNFALLIDAMAGLRQLPISGVVSE